MVRVGSETHLIPESPRPPASLPLALHPHAPPLRRAALGPPSCMTEGAQRRRCSPQNNSVVARLPEPVWFFCLLPADCAACTTLMALEKRLLAGLVCRHAGVGPQASAGLCPHALFAHASSTRLVVVHPDGGSLTGSVRCSARSPGRGAMASPSGTPRSGAQHRSGARLGTRSSAPAHRGQQDASAMQASPSWVWGDRHSWGALRVRLTRQYCAATSDDLGNIVVAQEPAKQLPAVLRSGAKATFNDCHARLPSKRVSSAPQVDAPAGTCNGASAAPPPASAAAGSLGQLQDPALWQLPAFSQGAAFHKLGYGHVLAGAALAACSAPGSAAPLGMPLPMMGLGSLTGFGFQGLLPLSVGGPALPGALAMPQLQLDLPGAPALPGLPRSASALHLARGSGLRSALSQGAASHSAAGAGSGMPGVQPGGLEAMNAWRAAADYGGLGLAAPGAYAGSMGPRSSSTSNLPALGAAGQGAWMPGAHRG